MFHIIESTALAQHLKVRREYRLGGERLEAMCNILHEYFVTYDDNYIPPVYFRVLHMQPDIPFQTENYRK